MDNRQILAAEVDELYIQCGKPSVFSILHKLRDQYPIKTLEILKFELTELLAKQNSEQSPALIARK